ncbi:MAG: PAS domain-containing protein [Methanospirillaceae archaeon]|nr:PAS domain-containing protein [Methanospirillaceae archaeon]
MNRTARTVTFYLGLGLLAGIIFWIIESLAVFFFYKSILLTMIFDMPDSLADAFVYSVTPSSMLARITFFLFSIGAVLVIAIVRLKQYAADASWRESEERMRALLNSIDDLHGMISPAGFLLFKNDALRCAFFIPSGTNPDTPFISFLDSPLDEEVEHALTSVFETQRYTHFEGKNQGSWYDITMYPVYGEEKEITSIGFFAHDISAKKMAEEALIENETRYQELFHAIPSGFVLCNVIRDETGDPQDYLILDCNTSFEAMMQQPAHAIKNHLLTEFIPIQEREKIEQFHVIIKSGHPGRLSVHSTIPDRYLNLFIFRTPAPDQYGALITDTTDMHRLIEEQKDSLQQINKNLEELAILNDAIRNPLAVILALIEIYECPNQEGIIEQVNQIDTIITRLDQRWLESDKVRNFLIKHYSFEEQITS